MRLAPAAAPAMSACHTPSPPPIATLGDETEGLFYSATGGCHFNDLTPFTWTMTGL